MRIGLHIFHRDLRIDDNGALYLLSKQVDYIIPIFIFDKNQIIENEKNKKFRSNKAIKFMIQSLEDLDQKLRKYNSRLLYFFGEPNVILEKIIKSIKISCVSFNMDFSKYSIKRDSEIYNLCKKNNIKLLVYEHDLFLNDSKSYLNNNKPYLVFGVFYKKAIRIKVRDLFSKTKKFINKKNHFNFEFKKDINKFYKETNILVNGGRNEALKILKNISKFKNYKNNKDFLDYQTTLLSTYLKFGCVSINEVYFIFKKFKLHDLIRQLYWRLYYFILVRYYYNSYGHSDIFFNKIKWRNNIKEAKLLWSGNSGFPIIDACVRQLLNTGFMHNRGRLLVSNFAIKILHQDPFNWYWGGQLVFSRTLIDCCYANNYGNWNFALGPYDLSGYRFGKKNTKSGRIYRDIINFKRFDPKLKFVRKFVPELNKVPDKDVFNWYYVHNKYNIKYEPMVDFDDKIKKWYKLTQK